MKEHLAKRGVHDPSLYVVRNNDLVAFQMWDMTGKLFGYCNYRWYGEKDTGLNDWETAKYFVRTIKPSSWVMKDGELTEVFGKSLDPYWGLHSWKYSNVLFLTEGLFDAARVMEAGYSAMAVFANDPKKWQCLKLWRKVRPVVTLCDGDKAGMKLAKYGHEHYVLPEGKDANDFSPQELKKVLDSLGHK